jgi:hypothetical protein
MGEERTRAVHCVLEAAPLIFNMPAPLFARAHPRDKEPELLALLKFPGDTKFPIFAPVLYTNQIKNPRGLFQSLFIANVCIVLPSLI